MTVETKPVTATKPLVEMNGVGKRYGNIRALSGISLRVGAGEITCVLGDNGAGKSALIKIISGLHQHDEGELLVDGEDVRFTSPREALDRGIATVYQDLAVVAVMPIWRNFFLGSEVRMPISRETAGQRLHEGDEQVGAAQDGNRPPDAYIAGPDRTRTSARRPPATGSAQSRSPSSWAAR